MTLLETRGLSRRYGGVTAVNDVSFRLERGEIRSIIGPNGAGKTTFVSMICGRIAPSAGLVFFENQDITGLSPWRRVMRGIVYTFQITSIYPRLTVAENVALAVQRQLTAKPSKGSCTFAMGFTIEQGKFGEVPLDGLGFIVIGFTPEEMGKGNWSAGVIVDERASTEQRDAIVAVASGAAGGPMSALSGLIANFVGVQSAPIRVERDGLSPARMRMPTICSGTVPTIIAATLESMRVSATCTMPLPSVSSSAPAAALASSSRRVTRKLVPRSARIVASTPAATTNRAPAERSGGSISV